MMKRGLSSLDLARSARAVYSVRQQRLRESLRASGVDAGILYADVSSGSDIAYLTHATLYWSYGAVLVFVDGPTVFLPGLSPRTEEWFSANSVFDRIVSSTDLGGAVADLGNEFGIRALGLIDSERFPVGLREDLFARGGFDITGLGSLVREMRLHPDADALRASVDAARLGAAALDAVAGAVSDGRPYDAGADAEYTMRFGGAWDAGASVGAAGSGYLASVRCQVRDGWFAAFHHIGDETLGHMEAAVLETMRRAARDGNSEDAAERAIADAIDTSVLAGKAVTVAASAQPSIDIEAAWRPSSSDVFDDGQLVYMAGEAWSETGERLFAVSNVFQVGIGEGTLISSL